MTGTTVSGYDVSEAEGGWSAVITTQSLSSTFNCVKDS